ncbi:MAG: transporter permease [Paenibacillus sp.]|jgi:putative aldouronate transport system permease protein|nr:transporter permease [Paenibacillus sp.]
MSLIIQKTKADRVTDVVLYGILTVFGLVTLFPFYYVIVMSMTPLKEIISSGGFVLLPKQWTLEAYRIIFSSPTIPQALKITVIVTVLGTTLSLLLTILAAYPLSKTYIPGRNGILLAIVFTMLFSGGLIPLYLVVNGLGLMNTIWALILPGLISTFNMLVMKTFFEHLPVELEEAARVDGCGDWRTLLQIVLPLSVPMLVTIGLFYGVANWNAYFGGIMYITDRGLYPLQVVLKNMIQTPNIGSELVVQNAQSLNQLPPETVKMATVVVATLPIIIVYPFLQKYFIKGMLIGAIKG